MIPNYADGGDLTNELEVVCYFVRGAGTSLARPLVTREPTIRRQRRNVVTPERQSAREAEWAALPLSPVARVSFRRSVKEPWGALQAPDRGRMPLDHSDYDRGGQKGLFCALSQHIFRSMHSIAPKFCERSGNGQT